MHYEVNIDEFSGPLDLLLHLIKKDNIDIYDISLEKITNEYLEYIKKMEEMNLDIASEYLVMASELIEYKSRSLLRQKDEEEIEQDPKEELIKRLVDYKSEYDESLKNDGLVSVDDLMEAFKKFLSRKEYEKPLNTKVTTKELSVSDRIIRIRDILKNKREVNFIELFDDFSKKYVVVTFLSILEMSKNNEIVIMQENNFENIIIKGMII